MRVGHAALADGTSGVTVVRTDAGARAAHWVPGSATGSREWGVFDPDHVAARVHAVCLAGGSAFGLAAADGVMRALRDNGVGFDTGHGLVPIVPAAILFDLDVGSAPPGADLGEAAARAARHGAMEQGAVGAGAGARVGRGLGVPVQSGIGTACLRVGAHHVGALVALNAFGAVVDPATGAARSHPDHVAPIADTMHGSWRGNTTLAVIATDAPIERATLRVLAKMATAAFGRCLRPACTPFDGDVVIALSTAEGPGVDAATLTRLGDAAATALERAIVGLFPAPRQ